MLAHAGTFATTRDIGVAINHEDMTDAEVSAAITLTSPSWASQPPTP